VDPKPTADAKGARSTFVRERPPREETTMSKPSKREPWPEDFGYVLTADDMRLKRQDYASGVFAGSKPLAWTWLCAVAVLGGALGGTLVSGALWRSLVQVPLWLGVSSVTGLIIRRATLAVFGPPLGFFVGWTFFWSMLIGLVAMWGAGRAGSGWAYGIAAGVGFFVGMVGGVYEPDDLENRDLVFATSLVSAPLGACAAVWLHRNLMGDPASLVAAAITGAVAGILFLAPTMGALLANLNTVQGLTRLALLLLHRDDTAAEAVPMLDKAARLAPDDASLLAHRGLAHALSGRGEAAEADWARQRELKPKSPAPEVARGWAHLRRGRHAEAAASFEAALAWSKRHMVARIGLGLARLRSGDAAGAVESLDKVPAKHHDALSLTHLAEAHLAAGNPKRAADVATDAIDELDSVFGRTWLVRAEAKRALGDIEGAARDFNTAWHVAEEVGVQDRARAGLEAIERFLEEEEPEEESER
jgi:tetratricopeptide (TPR) repeat protein